MPFVFLCELAIIDRDHLCFIGTVIGKEVWGGGDSKTYHVATWQSGHQELTHVWLHLKILFLRILAVIVLSCNVISLKMRLYVGLNVLELGARLVIVQLFDVSKRQQKEDPFVPVPVGPFKKWRNERQYLVGGQRQRDIPVFFQTQGSSCTSLGNPERKPQKNDLSEDGTCVAQLWQNWRGKKDKEEADIPVQWWGAGEESSGEKTIRVGRRDTQMSRFIHHVCNSGGTFVVSDPYWSGK